MLALVLLAFLLFFFTRKVEPDPSDGRPPPSFLLPAQNLRSPIIVLNTTILSEDRKAVDRNSLHRVINCKTSLNSSTESCVEDYRLDRIYFIAHLIAALILIIYLEILATRDYVAVP
jgi:hypothetical protein